MNSKFKHHYEKTYHRQKYDLKYILTCIVSFINNYDSWRSLGNGWNNIYKHFIKLVEWKILDTSFIDLLESYANKRNGKYLKVIMIDTSTILNKNVIIVSKISFALKC